MLATLGSGAVSEMLRGVAPGLPTAEVTLQRGMQVATLGAALLLWFAATGHYSRRKPLEEELRSVCAGMAVTALVDGCLQFVYQAEISRGWVLLTWPLALGFILICRILGKQALYELGPWRCPTLIVGTTAQTQQIEDILLRDHHLGYVPTQLVDIEQNDAQTRQRISQILGGGGVRQVVISIDGTDLARSLEIARLIDDKFDVPLALATNLRGLEIRDLQTYHVFGCDCVFLNNNRLSQSRLRALAKRAFDICAASVLLLIASPILLLVGAVVCLDGGPPLYGSTRIGRNGRLFTAFKIRSMVPDGERRLQDLLQRDPAAREAWARQFKIKNDPRVTPVGRFLRRTSLDELPQLVNVLLGQMSLVGPRPMLPEERERYDPAAFELYLRVTPGLTGMWQVSGRDDVEYLRRIELNNWYVKNWSPWLDLLILLRTAVLVLKRTGAS